MGYRSDVKIKMGRKAYELLSKNCKAAAINYSKEIGDTSAGNFISEMITDPDVFKEYKCSADTVLIGWNYSKWYKNYKDVKAVEDTLLELNEIVGNDESKLEDYFYKKIEIGEDNATTEQTNDYNEIYTNDFYVKCCFSL